jgi:hypothetical protein
VRSSRGLLAAALLAAAAAGGCHPRQSFIVVTVESVDATPIDDVADLQVTVANGDTTTLTYPAPNRVPLTITGTPDPRTGKTGTTLSVSFSPSRSDDATIQVAARDPGLCIVGLGSATAPIKIDGVGGLTVQLAHTRICPPPDAGVNAPMDAQGTLPPDAGSDGPLSATKVIFPGCDPIGASCGAQSSCAVACAQQQAICVAAGDAGAASVCAASSDCAPGTQCFTYTGPSCAVSACLRFCASDADCGPGTGSLCRGTVPCAAAAGSGSIVTGYHTCTLACDPRGAATAGCPAGLHCFVVGDGDQVDCACTEASRTGVEGGGCARGSDCAPGLICNTLDTASTGICRAICQRSLGDADCPAGRTCTALRGDTIYGACLP